VLISSRNALERNPSTVAKLNEEQIRDVLLIGLNTQFEGNVGGEVFNGAGKTDILVRVDDRNIFIGECKIWKGPKTVTDALNQLLSYLVWRDTKAALLIFIRSGHIASITATAVTAIRAHPKLQAPRSPRRRGPPRLRCSREQRLRPPDRPQSAYDLRKQDFRR